jgi:hypothetical protein
MVPALPDYVYNLITYTPAPTSTLSKPLVINGRFTHLSSGQCPPEGTTTCWSHTGTYLSTLGISYLDSSLTVTAGPHDHGFSSWTNKGVNTGMVLDSSYRARIRAGPFELTIENSDRFINIVSVIVVSDDLPEATILSTTTGLLVSQAVGASSGRVGKGEQALLSVHL